MKSADKTPGRGGAPQESVRQGKVSVPSTDGDGPPTLLTRFLDRLEQSGPFPAVLAMLGCNGLVAQDESIVESTM